MTRLLGIETSCDETAAAIVSDGARIESNVIASQTDLHARYGGVMPEQASRAHLRAIQPVVEQALTDARVDWSDIDAIAVTHGPGLAGALLVGVNVAKGIAFALSKPLLGINHLEGHVYANWLTPGEPRFPLVALIVSGGHSDLVLADGHGAYQRLGRTRDDAAGEAFDKVARLLGLGFPGGPLIEREAANGDPARFALPRAWLDGESFDFSFSGLKTAVRNQVAALGVDPDTASPKERRERLPVADLAASFQQAVVDVLSAKIVRAAETYGAINVALAGGVAANRTLLRTVEDRAQRPILCPPPRLCTDNAAMIAAAAYFRYTAGQRNDLSLDVEPGLPIA
ncbi:MAG: tRNA (adenosine(37)-N6)-threonylcarbamoyltransferase complex transferase subunit TsaD [Chloroflexi bacterium]|nr:tRNA (adenosine(37)-N6)-threonylcarbamoyltransferase complex transferase subunit TsaD [Chloroflexota bacterium]MBV9543246.1 tRNA (adenosine(37)-N6)-threonylcarbamoyltransferase complex transferase subunit TsaD [Chloroflexota bacterium]